VEVQRAGLVLAWAISARIVFGVIVTVIVIDVLGILQCEPVNMSIGIVHMRMRHPIRHGRNEHEQSQQQRRPALALALGSSVKTQHAIHAKQDCIVDFGQSNRVD
jgi:hypothetical protein